MALELAQRIKQRAVLILLAAMMKATLRESHAKWKPNM
jgi:hypothetical protein